MDFGYTVIEDKAAGRFTISPTEYGILDYYPKANKVLIRSKNKWIKGGLLWIINKLLK